MKTPSVSRIAARYRREQDPTPMTDMSGYIDELERMFLLPYPAIYDALGVEKSDVRVKKYVGSSSGHLIFTVPSIDTEVEVHVKPNGDHIVAGSLQGETLAPKRFPFRQQQMGMHRGTQGTIVSYIEDNYHPKSIYTYQVAEQGRTHVFSSVDELLRAYPSKGVYRGPARQDLQGQPILEGFAGPMWNGRKGDVGQIRYETFDVFHSMD